MIESAVTLLPEPDSPDDGKRLRRREGEAQTVDDIPPGAAAAEGDRQATDLDERFRRAAALRRRR